MSNHGYLLIIVLTISFGYKGTSQLSTYQIDSLRQLLSSTKEDTTRVNLYMQLGNEIGYTDLNAALDYAQQGYELSKKIGFPKGQGRSAYLSAISYMELGDLEMTDSMLFISGEIFKGLQDISAQAKISNAKGNRHYIAGNYLLAANYYSEAAGMFDIMGDSTNSLIAYQNLIAMLGQINQHEKAANLGKKILSRIANSTDTLQLGYTLQGLTTDLIYINQLEEAGQYIEQLLSIGNTTQDQNLSADIFGTIGSYHFKLHNYQKAIFFFETAKLKADKLGNKFQEVNHLNSLGQCFLEIGNLKQSGDYLVEGMNLASQHGIKSIESKLHLSLSKLYHKQNQDQEAYNALLQHKILNDSLLNIEVINQAIQLETQFETNKKDKEINDLKQTQLEKDFEIRRRNTYLATGGGIILLLSGGIYLMVGIYQNRQELARQQNMILEEKVKIVEKEQQVTSLQSMIDGQESERTRIARDLHDGLGGLFSTVKMHFSTLQQDTPAIKNNMLYQKTLDLINNAADELRKVAHNMMPEVLMKLGLIEALREFCNNISSGRLLEITFQTFGMEARLNSSTEIMLYRIVQELVNNIIKHADATEAIIQINRDQNRLSLTIEDNGRGFDTEEAQVKRGMGLEAVRSRVVYLNGQVTVDSVKNIGTTIMIDLIIND